MDWTCEARDEHGQPCVLGRGHQGPHATAEQWAPEPASRRYLRRLLALWVIGYPVVSCSPMVLSDGSGGATAATALGSYILAGALFLPWLIGVIVLGVLFLLTRR